MIERLETLSAERALEESGFRDRSLSDMPIPPWRCFEAPDGYMVNYRIWGNIKEAKTIVISPLSYTVGINDASDHVHSLAQQEFLGDEVCLVTVEDYSPTDSRMSRSQKRELKKGSFKPLADRVLAVIEQLGLTEDQLVALYGYSKGADVSVETAFQNLTNPNHGGVHPITWLGVFELARTKTRGGPTPLVRAIKMATAFGASGPDLYDNVTLSLSPALLEARGIDLDDPKAEKKHDWMVQKGVGKYVLRDIPGNIALGSGFGYDQSLRQLNNIANYPDDRPLTTAGRGNKSIIFSRAALEFLTPHSDLTKVEFAGDHSRGDYLPFGLAALAKTLQR